MKSPALQTAIYAIGEFLPRAIGFVLLPLYTVFLRPEDYGALAVLDMVGVYFGIVVNAGFSSALMRFWHEQDDERWHARVFSTAMATAFGLALLGALLIVPVAPLGARLLFADEARASLIVMVVVAVGLEVCNNLVLTLFRLKEDPDWHLRDTILRLLVAVPLNVWFIAVLGMGIRGFVLSNLITAVVIFATIGLGFVWKHRARPERELGRGLFAFAAPFIPVGLLETFVNNLGVLCLTLTGNLAATGLFGVGQKIGGLVSYAYSPVGAVWVPYMFKIARRPDAKLVYARSVTVLCALLGGLVVLLCAFSHELVGVMAAADYGGAAAVIFPLALGSLFFVLRPTIRIGMSLARRTGWMPITTGVPAALGFPLTWWLARSFGAEGAAFGVAATMAAIVVLTAAISHRYLALPYEFGRLARIALVLAVCCGVALALDEGAWTWKALVALAYPTALFVLGVPSVEERRVLKDWRRWLVAESAS